MRISVLYLTFFEAVTGSGIYDSQVKQMLCQLGKNHGSELRLYHVAILPAMVVGRRGILCPAVSEREQMRAVREEYRQSRVQTTFLFAPVVIPQRWQSHPGLPLVFVMLALCFPALLYMVWKRHCEVIHCRSYVATLYALAIKVVRPGVKVIFDPRGFYAEEGVIQHRYRQESLTYRIWKRLERYMCMRCDRAIALSDVFADHLSAICSQVECSVIYAGAELQRFEKSQTREQKRRELNLHGSTVFVYNGSLGWWHDPELLARVYRALKGGWPDSKLLVVSHFDREKLANIFQGVGLAADDYLVVSVWPDRVPEYLLAADYGIVPLRESVDSEPIRLVADTMIGLKVAEYLASGLPIIVNEHVRGIRSLMQQFRIGISFDPNSLGRLVADMRSLREQYSEYQANCRIVAREFLSIDHAATSYYQVYQEVMGMRSGKESTEKILPTLVPLE